MFLFCFRRKIKKVLPNLSPEERAHTEEAQCSYPGVLRRRLRLWSSAKACTKHG